MGGPQAPDTTLEECPHFDAQEEVAFIARAIADGKFLLGVCLGAQLVGEALGAKFDHSPNREIGVYALDLTDDGKMDPIFESFPDSFLVGHWHGDMPGLTSAAKVLAISEGCPRQIVRYSERIYGFQCHFEFTPAAIEGMISNCGEECEAFGALPYVQNAEQLRSNSYGPMNELLFTFLDWLEASHELEQSEAQVSTSGIRTR
jgi:GMP synthase (glutamine-hydrolysing)